MTTYHILKKLEGNFHWQELSGVVEASSARRAMASTDLEAGEYVAIPVRSWKPLTVKVEQTTKVTIS